MGHDLMRAMDKQLEDSTEVGAAQGAWIMTINVIIGRTLAILFCELQKYRANYPFNVCACHYYTCIFNNVFFLSLSMHNTLKVVLDCVYMMIYKEFEGMTVYVVQYLRDKSTTQ